MNIKRNNQLLINCGLLIAIALLIILVGKLKPQNKPAIAETAPKTETVVDEEELPSSPLQKDRPLKMSISVDNPSFLKVRLNDEIKTGDVISDNSNERQRLERQKKSIKLQIENLNSKTLIAPTPPPPTPLLRNLPPSAFSEELAAISQNELKLKQARAILASRSKLLTTDNPERRAEFEKAGASLAIAQQKIQEQEQMIAAMGDMKMQPEILQHEQSKLKKLQSEFDQAQSEVDQSQAKLSAAAIVQNQELEQLQTNVALAESELQVAKSKLEAARNRRQIQEYQASVDESKRSQSETQSRQDYERSRLQYEEAVRNKDYQLAQLDISLSAIDDKLADIPIVRSPRDGYIKKVKPWVGKDGKYTTSITIISNNISPKNGSGNRSKPSTPTKSDSNPDKTP
jgi:multidrug resistance efflux pump